MAKKRVKRNRKISDEKLKDMVESILPCKRNTHKTIFQYKRMECRKIRRRVRQDIRTCDREGYTDRHLLRKPRQKEYVEWRRSADKLNHFMRWGDRLTEGMDQEEALAYIRRILPRNLIGDHAYSHWKSHLKRKSNKAKPS